MTDSLHDQPPGPGGADDAGSALEALERLNTVARLATAGLELVPMLQRITDLLVHELGWDHAGFARIDRARGVFVAEAISSRIPVDIAPGYVRPLGSGVVGEVAQTGVPITIPDIAIWPGYVPVARDIRCEICLPIFHGGEVVAILNVEDRRARVVERELPLLEAIARQIGGAIASARLHEEVARRAEQFELLADLSRLALEAEDLDTVLQTIAGRLRDRFDLLVASFYFVDSHRPRLELKALATRYPPPDTPLTQLSAARGIVGRALHLRRAQLVLDVRNDPDYVPLFPTVTSELAIPIHFRGRSLGVFNFEHDRPQVFTREAVALLQTLSDQLAGLVHLAVLNRKLQETTDDLEQTNRRLQEMNRSLEELSIVDALTGLSNRRQFDRALDLEWRRAIRAEVPLSLLLFDIDFFKRYNDSQGHLRGDATLVEVAQTLQGACTRAGDVVARYGGEEFAALLPDTAAAAALELAEQARARVEARGIVHPASDCARVVTVSVGVATTVPDPWRLPSSLLERCDRALYAAKAGARNCTRVAG